MDEDRKERRKRELRHSIEHDEERVIDDIIVLEEELDNLDGERKQLAKEYNRVVGEYNELESAHKSTLQWIHDLKEPPLQIYSVRKNEPESNRVLVSDGKNLMYFSYGLKLKEERHNVGLGMKVAIGAVPTPVRDEQTGEFVIDPRTGKPLINPVKAVTEILYSMEDTPTRIRLLRIEDGGLYGLAEEDIAVYETSSSRVETSKIPRAKAEPLRKLKNIEVDMYLDTMDIVRVVSEASKVDVRKSMERITYKDVGGLDHVIEQVREVVEVPIKHPEVYERFGIDPPKGILLYGPPGTGKTLMAKAIANETGMNFFSFSGAEVMNKFYGESEAKLRKIFEEAEQNTPSIIFIDELDALAPKRDDTQEVEKRVVAQLLALMDGLENRGKVIVIGATNRINDLDPAIRRPGRFDKEILLPTPGEDGRYKILQIHTRKASLEGDSKYREKIKSAELSRDAGTLALLRSEYEKHREGVLREMSSILHGYTGADIKMLVTEAGLRALRRNKEKILAGGSVSLDEYEITKGDFMAAYEAIKPSSMREIHLEIPNVRWSDIGGLDQAKQELMQAIEWPLKYKELYRHAGMKPPKGILLYGPPGTGKTMLAKAVASESKVNFITIRGPEIYSKWVGESEKAVRELFERARQSKPCIILFDEIDAMTTKRGSISGDSGVSDKVLSQLLAEMDGMGSSEGVYVIGTTNKPHLIDEALLRPGRFDQKIEIALPDEKTRREIFKIHVNGKPLDGELDLELYVRETDGYTGADIEYICRRSEELAIRDFISRYGSQAEIRRGEFKVGREYFDRAIEELREKSGYVNDNDYRKSKDEALPDVGV